MSMLTDARVAAGQYGLAVELQNSSVFIMAAGITTAK